MSSCRGCLLPCCRAHASYLYVMPRCCHARAIRAYARVASHLAAILLIAMPSFLVDAALRCRRIARCCCHASGGTRCLRGALTMLPRAAALSIETFTARRYTRIYYSNQQHERVLLALLRRDKSYKICEAAPARCQEKPAALQRARWFYSCCGTRCRRSARVPMPVATRRRAYAAFERYTPSLRMAR